MPNPISSTVPMSESPSVEEAGEPSACLVPVSTGPAPNQCLAEPPQAESSTPSGASSLVESFSRRDYSAIIAETSPPPNPSPSRARYFEVQTSKPGEDASLTAAVIKSHGTPLASVSLLYVAAKAGPQNEAQIGLLQRTDSATVGGLHLSTTLEAATARVNLGTHNDDGSKGVNAGAMATAVGTEVTAEYSGWSLTAGISASVGAAFSTGEGRDIDGDGKPERCFKGSFLIATLGVCTEL